MIKNNLDIYNQYLANKLDAKKLKSTKNDDQQLKVQTDAFESLLLKFMLDTALKLDNPLYPKQPGSEIYQSMYKESLSNQLSGHFGYSELLFNFLKDQEAQRKG
ncbi:hypothetical protein [Helicobacter suis]|uniref:Rod binding protein n=2 Tax=Helicobacter suis TaxID=104628 RepID=A0A6J4CWK7_9HELI|nr:hypothetical protein [Helicobacter suis]EFX42515.1 hypothetical rod binding protein [Helicobacter suis HS5]EFX42528.1 hypothetical protein HSUHS1_1179 [Helicobacter suis HS1]BCD45928.1 Hypothetical protein NHP190020_09670 [Helicobacter suis]BCD48144.1 Hypothetical protein NHP194003_13480 [Helicobacter suis]BCD49905.1 Hypothetical protein NHP194004_13520 [Helicobacter suis]